MENATPGSTWKSLATVPHNEIKCLIFTQGFQTRARSSSAIFHKVLMILKAKLFI